MTKKFFFEQHYFLRLQQQFPEKWGGGHMPPPVPPVPTALLSMLHSHSLFQYVLVDWHIARRFVDYSYS